MTSVPKFQVGDIVKRTEGFITNSFSNIKVNEVFVISQREWRVHGWVYWRKDTTSGVWEDQLILATKLEKVTI